MGRDRSAAHDLHYFVDFTEKNFANKLTDEINSKSGVEFNDVALTDALKARLLIDTLLRSIDLRHLKYQDVVDIHGNTKSHIICGQQKTKRTVECYLSAPTREAVAHWITVSNKHHEDYLFTHLRKRNDRPDNTPIGRNNMALIIKQCVSAIGLDPTRYSTKTLRKSRVKPILKLAAYNHQIPQILLGHANINSTIQYCEVDRDEALAISAAVQFFDSVELPKSINFTEPQE